MTFTRIYGEIGPGERIALSKLAVQKFEETRRPLRIAIDVSIWQFQIQAGRGGTNPAHRTFYYRILRLLSVSVQPIFVFDGPNKPKFKRGKRSGHGGASLSNFICKQILDLFGLPIHMAPGEAEAECALLQREGIVDAVLSEDVDTLMFGCGVTLRNWSADGRAKTPTHVNLYDAKVTLKGKSGLDREGMVLVALMSGGDYIVEGIPGVGIKVACEAARAGFGKSLCQLSRLDAESLKVWRDNLQYELQTNENKFFRCKHKTLVIPENFPDPEVLGYYTHPVVSNASKIQRLKEEIEWDGDIDIPGLRAFVAQAFEWTHKPGAYKFIRGLAPALLVHKLRVRGNRRESGYGDILLTMMNEMALVRSICGKRTHMSTDGTPELRVVYHPNDIVALDLDVEEDSEEDYDRDGLAPANDDDQIEAYAADEKSTSPSKRAPSAYDPTEPERIWIPHAIARAGIPLKVEDYEESLRNPKIKAALKKVAVPKKATAPKTRGEMPKGALDKFVKVTKKTTENVEAEDAPNSSKGSREASVPQAFSRYDIESMTPEPSSPQSASTSSFDSYTDAQLAEKIEQYGFKPVKRRAQMISLLEMCSMDQQESFPPACERSSSPVMDEPAAKANHFTRNHSVEEPVKSKPILKRKAKVSTQKAKPNINPWTLAQSSPRQIQPKITKSSSQRGKPSSLPATSDPAKCSRDRSLSPFSDLFSSPPPLFTTPRKHAHTPEPTSDNEANNLSASHMPNLDEDSQLLTPSSLRKDPCKPPPRKKPSPEAKFSAPPSRASLLTPEPVARRLDFHSESRQRDTSSSPELPSLEDIFASPRRTQKTKPKLEKAVTKVINEVIEILSSPEAPSRETRINMSPRRRRPKPSTVTSAPPDLPTMKLAEAEVNVVKAVKAKKFIMPRESLPGTWKEVGEEQATKRGVRAFRYSQVEVVDMTEGP